MKHLFDVSSMFRYRVAVNQNIVQVNYTNRSTTRSICTWYRLRICSCCDIEQSQMIFISSSRWRSITYRDASKTTTTMTSHISITTTREHQRNSFAHTHVTIYYRCKRNSRSHIIITCHTNKRIDWWDLNYRFEIVISHIFFRRLTWDTRTQRRDIVARDIRSDKTM